MVIIILIIIILVGLLSLLKNHYLDYHQRDHHHYHPHHLANLERLAVFSDVFACRSSNCIWYKIVLYLYLPAELCSSHTSFPPWKYFVFVRRDILRWTLIVAVRTWLSEYMEQSQGKSQEDKDKNKNKDKDKRRDILRWTKLQSALVSTEWLHKCNNHFIITTIMVESQFENVIVVGTNLRQSESNS